MSHELKQALEQIDGLLTNLQPHIAQQPQGRANFIDNYVSPALKICRQALASASTEPPKADPVASDLTDERIDYIAELVVKGMPDGIRGFCREWGWQQFARAIIHDCRPALAAHPEQAEPTVLDKVRESASRMDDGIEKLRSGDMSDLDTELLALAKSVIEAQGGSDDGLSQEEWLRAAGRVFLACGDSEEFAVSQAKYLYGEQDTDNFGDPHEVALEDIEGRPKQAEGAGAVVPAGWVQVEDGLPNSGDLVLCEFEEGILDEQFPVNDGFMVERWDESTPPAGVIRWVKIDKIPEGLAELDQLEGLKAASPHQPTDTQAAGRDAQDYMAALTPISDAMRSVIAERHRQVESEGWTAEHDDEHVAGELSAAAACYALGGERGDVPGCWPQSWDESWWRPSDNDRRNLVKAGALILAEIERLDRAATKGDSSHE